jgi:DNA-binding CsgD family transcriptional regulator
MFSVGMDPAAIDVYNKHYYQLDPIAPAVERKPVGTLVTDRDILAKTQLTRTEFYNDWVRPQDFGDCAMVTLFRDEARAGLLCLAAPERLNAFSTARSLDLLRQLTPHLQRATQVTLKMADQDALRSAGLEALDYLSDAVFITDCNGQVLFANRAAEAMLAEADGIHVGPSGLRAVRSAQTAALRHLISQSAGRDNAARVGGSLLLERPSGRRPLSVTVTPMHREAGWCPVSLRMAIIFVADPEHGGKMAGPRLRALYGMTPAEAAVAGLISKGAGVKAAARALAIAPSTVRTHLHRAFEKTGTRRQAELGHLVNQVASFSPLLKKQHQSD